MMAASLNPNDPNVAQLEVVASHLARHCASNWCSSAVPSRAC